MSFGKSIAITNLLFTMVVIAVISLIPVVDMKSGSWAVLMAAPFVAAISGLIYGIIGGTIYNMSAKKKGAIPVLEMQEGNS